MQRSIYLALGVAISAFCVFLWFFNVSPQLIQIPVVFTSTGIPMLSAVIEGKAYLLEFDLGSKFQMSLKKDVLDSIVDKKSHTLVQWRDAKGRCYESPSYLIPHVEVEGFVLTDVIARQDDAAYRANTVLWNDDKDKKTSTQLGGVGRPLLEKTNLLLDFQNARMIACNDEKPLKKAGFFLNQMVQVPFEEGKKGIIIKAETDAGVLRLALDSGATITLVRTARLQNQECITDRHGFSIYTTQKFLLGGHDFGSKNLFLYDIASELHELDGVLGMDFLENHVVYIDYVDKVIYIQRLPETT